MGFLRNPAYRQMSLAAKWIVVITENGFQSGTEILNQTANTGIQEADPTKGEPWLT
jgi:hypothetical protein